MRIGIDLDGVIFDSEKEYRVDGELYDVLDLKRNSLIDNREIKFQNRYNWSEEEEKGFIEKYHTEIMEKSNFMPGAKRVLKLLKEDGHELILVTARGGISKESIDITKRLFRENDLEIFDKYFWATENKGEVCKQENIDIMIDDSYEKCKDVASCGVKTIYLKDAPSYELEESEFVKVLFNWGEIYRYIREAELWI